jgi:coproporphyrinogen III oxidase-like Fe-S oxidoreductase
MGPGLYVHVPFCVRKCAYCAFYSRPAEPGLVSAWRTGIERELAALPANFAPESIFFGGGTPTALDEGDLARLLDWIRAGGPFARGGMDVRGESRHADAGKAGCSGRPA